MRTMYYSLLLKEGTVIDTDKTIREGAMIDIMKQPRFVYARNMHPYMEIIYMFSGSATHFVNKTEVKLEKIYCLSNKEHRIPRVLPDTMISELKFCASRIFTLSAQYVE
ncbi:MAG: hypothetical protein ACLTCI_05520 [[Clostridium] nexile]